MIACAGLSIGSLFSGIGGIEMGLESAIPGSRVAWQAECDPYARAVLAKHWPEVKRYEDVKDIDERAERVDIICGGFPCQDISNAGKREGIDGAKSGLWSEYARIIGALRPSVVFVENVSALLGRGMGRVLGELSALGYDAEWDCFRASDVGAPHRRERIFILGYTKSVGERESADETVAVATARRARDEPGHAGGLGHADDARRRELRIQITAEAQQPAAKRAGYRFPPGPSGVANWDGPQPAVCRGANGIPGRVDRLRCLGNAVIPQVAELAWKTLSERIGAGQ